MKLTVDFWDQTKSERFVQEYSVALGSWIDCRANATEALAEVAERYFGDVSVWDECFGLAQEATVVAIVKEPVSLRGRFRVVLKRPVKVRASARWLCPNHAADWKYSATARGV